MIGSEDLFLVVKICLDSVLLTSSQPWLGRGRIQQHHIFSHAVSSGKEPRTNTCDS